MAEKALASACVDGAAQGRPGLRQINLMELCLTLLGRWRTLLLAALIGATLAGAFQTFLIHPRYRASTELYITNNDSVISLQDLQMGSALTEDYQSIITSRAVLNRVIGELGLDVDYRKLRRLIAVSNPAGTHIIRISVTTEDFALSRDIANALMNASVERIFQIVGASAPTVIDYSEAEAVEDVTPGVAGYMARGALAGLMLVAVTVLARLYMDNTIKNDEDVEKYLQLPVLAAVPFFRD